MKKAILITLGLLSTGLGALGIILPGLPTTPFLLLAAFLFARSSKKLHKRLLENRYLGPFIKDFEREKGLSLKKKLSIISIILAMSLVSAWFFVPPMAGKIAVMAFGLVGVIVVGFVVRTVNGSANT
ncbi:hypothetical protein FUAX_30250 [Fulvitalea axinellae]|uniref:DUF454 domain-containing protein n=1 Tax=Fulvitalea axinellae TaxID=1182444 RepID=A0AAU9CR71_9BACT|nr:hypothetical protein FUAX_30250 [Fulvitalea axinellae]